MDLLPVMFSIAEASNSDADSSSKVIISDKRLVNIAVNSNANFVPSEAVVKKTLSGMGEHTEAKTQQLFQPSTAYFSKALSFSEIISVQ